MSGGGEGFSAIPNWMMRDPDIRPHTKLIFGYLLGRQNGDGIAFPSQRTMAHEVGYSVETVKRALRDLERMDLLMKRVVTTSTGRHNQYRLMTDRLGRRW